VATLDYLKVLLIEVIVAALNESATASRTTYTLGVPFKFTIGKVTEMSVHESFKIYRVSYEGTIPLESLDALSQVLHWIIEEPTNIFEALHMIRALIIFVALLIVIFTKRGFEIQSIEDVLTQEECQQVISDAQFSPSTTIGGTSDLRTSETAWLPKDHPVARKVLLRACELSGRSLENCEDLQVVRYKPGTFYKEHQDSCCDGSQECSEFLKTRGERVGTLLVYLNSDFTEGETNFSVLKKRFRPDPGSGIFWNPKGCPPEALHAGMPVSTGVKYVCNAWVRQH